MKVKHLTKIYNILDNIDKKIDVLLYDKPKLKLVETEAEWESNLEQQADEDNSLDLGALTFSNSINDHKSIFICPYDNEAALMVNIKDKTYYCFSCKSKGKIIYDN